MMNEGFLSRLAAARRSDALDRYGAWDPRAAVPAPPPSRRSLEGRLRAAPGVIAEVKRRSPSRGELRPDMDAAAWARRYESAGAAAISVLTEREHFGGSLDDLCRARAATELPLLRKDFLLHPAEIRESARAGADAVLLIARILGDEELRALLACARACGLEALVEAHDERELARALAAGATLVGVNNRDLDTLEVDPATAERLLPRLPPGCLGVAESGIGDAAAVRRYARSGARGFLVGESLVTSADPEAALRALVAAAREAPAPSRVRVKVCGITRPQDAAYAVALGADALGFVFWEGSPRRVPLETARAIVDATPYFVTCAGVFAGLSPAEAARLAGESGMDLAQLHDPRPGEVPAAWRNRLLPAFAARGRDVLESIRRSGAGTFVLDSGGGGLPGGSGRTFDWTLAREASALGRLVLAGGLTAENVGEAIAVARPYAVDVATGVEERPGVKDRARLAEFMDAVERAGRA